MALTFVIPLRNATVTDQWPLVEQLCRETVASVLAQDCADFQAIVVCKEEPDLGQNLPAQLTVVSDEFPDPPSHKEQLADKYRKLQRGLVEVRTRINSEDSTHVMVVDADDLVSRRLAGFVAERRDQPGWIFEQGYYHQAGKQRVVLHDDFHLYCGTSAIVRCRAEDLPESMNQPKEEIPILAAGHHEIARRHAEAETPLAPLPFPGAVYRVETGENWTNFAYRDVESRKYHLKRLLRTRPLGARLRDEFTFPEPH